MGFIGIAGDIEGSSYLLTPLAVPCLENLANAEQTLPTNLRLDSRIIYGDGPVWNTLCLAYVFTS